VADRLLIRPEREADHSAIAEVVRAAFIRQPDEVAAFFERIRASEHSSPSSRWSPRTTPRS
jgi:predicted N-acetyltransferase YhbS